MVNKVRFSVIIPNYNFAKYLEKAILSVIEQDYANKEIIVIDGGSNDESVDVIKKYENHIAYWISEKDKGTYDANNKGLKQITGDYWCILNSDDILLPGALKTVAHEIEMHPETKWLAGSYYVIDEHGNVTREIIPERPEPLAGYTFLEGCWISHPCTFIHKDVIKEVGIFARWHIMDYDYWLRMEDNGNAPHLVKERIAALRIHSGCKSYDQVNLYQEALNIRIAFCKAKNLLEFPEVKMKFKKETEHIVRLRIGAALLGNKRLRAFQYLVKFILRYPGSVSQRWVWGTVRRVLTGLDKNDPILESVTIGANPSNWNYK